MTAVIRILVVDDHTLFRRGLTALLQTQAQFQVCLLYTSRCV